MEAVDIIKNELQRVNSKQRHSGDNVYICCPYHGELDPSLGISLAQDRDIPLGSFHCFGCGESGSWNKLAYKLGLRFITERDLLQLKIAELTQFTKIERSEQNFLVDFNESQWRGISGELVTKVGGKLGFDKYTKLTCLYLPVIIHNEHITNIKAQLVKSDKVISYVLGDRTGIKKKGLFPFDYVDNFLTLNPSKYLFIVEGSRDALKLIDYGIPALAILGAKMWSKEKRNIILRLCEKHNVIPVIMMDYDTTNELGYGAGQDMQKRIFSSLNFFTATTQIKLERIAKYYGLVELDPAELANPILNYLRIETTLKSTSTTS